MKLKATYVKLSVGRIMATITVIDKGYYIENIKKSFLTDKEAVEWVRIVTGKHLILHMSPLISLFLTYIIT